MNRYSLWKYIVVAVAVVVGVLFTLPKVFPEPPAVQVSAPKVKVEAALLGTIEEALKGANIPYRGAVLDATGIKVRFDDTDTQLKAKEVIQAKIGDNYIVALNLLSSSPRWLTSIGALPMYLDLDLRGGVHFLLQVDMNAAIDKAGDRYTTDIRSLMRGEKIQYGGIARDQGNVVLRFKDGAERGAAGRRPAARGARPRSGQETPRGPSPPQRSAAHVRGLRRGVPRSCKRWGAAGRRAKRSL